MTLFNNKNIKFVEGLFFLCLFTTILECAKTGFRICDILSLSHPFSIVELIMIGFVFF